MALINGQDILEKLSIFQRILQMLSWKKIGQIATVAFIFIVVLTVYELRDKIHDIPLRISGNYTTPIASLSKQSIEMINLAVTSSELIVGIRIVTVDFHKNTRHVIYSFSDDAALEQIYTKSDTSMIFPLFTDDVVNNKRIVDLINGEYICDPYPETIGAVTTPTTKAYIHTICANGIPPYYGIFSGIVSISTHRQPTVTEYAQLRELARSMATVIYERDLK